MSAKSKAAGSVCSKDLAKVVPLRKPPKDTRSAHDSASDWVSVRGNGPEVPLHQIMAESYLAMREIYQEARLLKEQASALKPLAPLYRLSDFKKKAGQ